MSHKCINFGTNTLPADMWQYRCERALLLCDLFLLLTNIYIASFHPYCTPTTLTQHHTSMSPSSLSSTHISLLFFPLFLYPWEEETQTHSRVENRRIKSDSVWAKCYVYAFTSNMTK
jgi:hypothetical protein